MSDNILGIDISKKTFDVALMIDEKILRHKFSNEPKGHKLLGGWLRSLRVERVHACLEATGPYGEELAEYLHEQGHKVSVVNPLRIKAYAQSDLQRNKTDRADARVIADFCRVKEPAEWHPPSPEAKHLRALTRRLESLDRMRLTEQNRLDTAQAEVRPSHKRVIQTLEKEIKTIKRHIKEHVDSHPDLKTKSELLQTIPGIGEKTAHVLLGELEFSAYKCARSLAAQAGVTPGRSQSGTTRDRTRLSKVGNSRIRKALYLPAIVAARYNQVVKDFASRLTRNGKTPMQVVCASMRKLLHIAFGVIKHHRPFDPTLA